MIKRAFYAYYAFKSLWPQCHSWDGHILDQVSAPISRCKKLLDHEELRDKDWNRHLYLEVRIVNPNMPVSTYVSLWYNHKMVKMGQIQYPRQFSDVKKTRLTVERQNWNRDPSLEVRIVNPNMPDSAYGFAIAVLSNHKMVKMGVYKYPHQFPDVNNTRRWRVERQKIETIIHGVLLNERGSIQNINTFFSHQQNTNLWWICRTTKWSNSWVPMMALMIFVKWL